MDFDSHPLTRRASSIIRDLRSANASARHEAVTEFVEMVRQAQVALLEGLSRPETKDCLRDCRAHLKQATPPAGVDSDEWNRLRKELRQVLTRARQPRRQGELY